MTDEPLPSLRRYDRWHTKKCGEFEIDRKLGEGGFGAVYKVRSATDGDMMYAMKVERADDKHVVLKMEVRVMKALQQVNARHACRVLARGRDMDRKLNYVIMTLVGPSLDDLKRRYGVSEGQRLRFKSPTSLRLAWQTLEAIEDLHKAGFIHRDLKPSNFAIGRPQLNEIDKVYMLDFGLCREYRKKETGEIRTPRKDANFRGTTRYAPLNCHLRVDLSRKDDLESWLYMTIEWTCGALPWSHLDQSKVDVGKAKEAARSDRPRLDLMHNCPKEYDSILAYVDNVKYWEEPDYGYIYKLLEKTMKKHRPVITQNAPFDWEERK